MVQQGQSYSRMAPPHYDGDASCGDDDVSCAHACCDDPLILAGPIFDLEPSELVLRRS